MKEELKAAISKHAKFDQQQWDDVLQHFTPMIVSENTRLIRIGEVASYFYYIQKGAIRSYYLSDSKEANADFFFEGSFVTSLRSFVQEEPSWLALETMEQCELLCLHKQAYDQLSSTIVLFNSFARRLSEEALIQLHSNTDLLLASPEERLQIVASVKPHYVRRVPLQYLSSFLQIPVADLFRMIKKYEWNN